MGWPFFGPGTLGYDYAGSHRVNNGPPTFRRTGHKKLREDIKICR